ncbi:MAG TPA: GNAT family N-acetyltransferase [Gemmatimonadales bacterium]|nr:GNAT family N-acetyltransferase [Gemmatimonadales bacterium]
MAPAAVSDAAANRVGSTESGAPAVPIVVPVLRTARLLLGPYTESDVPDIVRLAGAREIFDTTLSIPHPYEPAHAYGYFAFAAAEHAHGTGLHLAVRVLEDLRLIGGIGLKDIERERMEAELGYWIGVEYWNRGYATEAAAAVVRHGFAVLDLARIHAHHLARNPASGRVLERIGMGREREVRQPSPKDGELEDVVYYSMLRDDLR